MGDWNVLYYNGWQAVDSMNIQRGYPKLETVNLRCTQRLTKPHPAAAPTSFLQIVEGAVATQTKTPVAGPRMVAEAATMIKTPAPVTFGLTGTHMSNSGSNPVARTAIKRAQMASWSRVAMIRIMIMNHNSHLTDPTNQIVVVVVPVRTTKVVYWCIQLNTCT